MQLLLEHDRAMTALEDAECYFDKKGKRRVYKVGGWCCFGGVKVDAIKYWRSEVRAPAGAAVLGVAHRVALVCSINMLHAAFPALPDP